MSEFNDRPLVADSIIGARHFDVDSLGRLRGVTHADVWRPGVNEAKCNKGQSVPFSVGGYLSSARGYGRSAAQHLWAYYNTPTFHVEVGDSSNDAADEKPDHIVASKDCACGFYAYTDTDLGYSQPGRIVGIIRGSGVATVGTRGFRAANAEIVALVEPHGMSVWRRFARLCSDRMPLPIALTIAGPLLTMLAGITTNSNWSMLALALTAIGLPASFGAFKWDMDYEAEECGTDDDRISLVCRNYPDVPRYRSLAAAMRDFPLSTPPEPSPEDDDFWTRSAR